jgi:ATP-dependent DNA ligase
MKKLYKKDSKGKFRIWCIYTQGAELIQEAGLVDGKLVKNVKICKGKNIGKINETTPEEQARLELESAWKSKKDEGYFDTLKEVNSIEVILPMLAKSYDDEKHKITWTNAYGQPKLDGMRGLWHLRDGNIEAISRDGKIIEGLDHIRKSLSYIKENVILDGELYAHGLNFQENMRLIKKYRPGETEQIKFHIYDTVSTDCFLDRITKVSKLVKNIDTCEIVETLPLNNENDLIVLHSQNLANGFEGTIVRWGLEGYKVNGRSSNLLKYKEFKDIAAKIIDVIPAEQRPEQGVPVLEFEGKFFQAGMKFSHTERQEWLRNKEDYIGKTAEIRFFEYSEDGIPRFPVCVGIRLDK